MRPKVSDEIQDLRAKGLLPSQRENADRPDRPNPNVGDDTRSNGGAMDKPISALVEMLRAASHDERLSTGALYREAADALEAAWKAHNELADSFNSSQETITAIRAEIERLTKLYAGQVMRADKFYIDNERLRAALEKAILGIPCQVRDPETNDFCGVTYTCIGCALSKELRAALNGEKE